MKDAKVSFTIVSEFPGETEVVLAIIVVYSDLVLEIEASDVLNATDEETRGMLLIIAGKEEVKCEVTVLTASVHPIVVLSISTVVEVSCMLGVSS